MTEKMKLIITVMRKLYAARQKYKIIFSRLCKRNKHFYDSQDFIAENGPPKIILKENYAWLYYTLYYIVAAEKQQQSLIVSF